MNESEKLKLTICREKWLSLREEAITLVNIRYKILFSISALFGAIVIAAHTTDLPYIMLVATLAGTLGCCASFREHKLLRALSDYCRDLEAKIHSFSSISADEFDTWENRHRSEMGNHYASVWITILYFVIIASSIITMAVLRMP